ncbi:hypothetical protein GYMLUDRAFT_157217 [Collybiopsis luxurians FD-317 M1]|nr:hypothetical protein GYMLUDRAFT_157217 [Collybiopsis luxurians FD-317 M1]
MPAPSLTPTYHRATYPAISPTKPSLSQAGKTVLITGGNSGIGFEAARSFAKASASRVIITGRRREILDNAVAILRDEFKSGTEFIGHQGDVKDDSSVLALWESLHSQNILVHVLVLNAASSHPRGPDTLSFDKQELMEAFNLNVGGNFLMASKFVKQPLRPSGQQLNLINVSSGVIQIYPAQVNAYASSKGAFVALLGRIAHERPVEDVQIISFHPGSIFTETAAKSMNKDAIKWDQLSLPADYCVWAASPEAACLHGRFAWAHWDVDELKGDEEVLKKLEEDKGYLKVGVQGLQTLSFDMFLNNPTHSYTERPIF